MSNDAVKAVHIFAYQVGFGDCFLLRFAYESGTARHVLIDFGSTALDHASRGSKRLLDIAQDIAIKCGNKLQAVVATHRHADHVSGFATNKAGTAPGDVIRSLQPDVVLQPWTEQLDLPTDARKPKPGTARGSAAAVLGLARMNAFSESLLRLLDQRAHGLPKELVGQLQFLGQDNIQNPSAVNNLASMGGERIYACYGSPDPLAAVLPGVRTSVLGPPTVEQSEAIKKMNSRNEAEYWHFQNMRMASEIGVAENGDDPFPKAPSRRGTKLPMSTRWVAGQVRAARGSQMLEIVRSLDQAMNNTSLILLFEVGARKLLFPGDAQFENWSYALSFPAVRRQLAGVDVYKVGHHGSLNATPKSMWKEFEKKSAHAGPRRLTSILSTLPGKHGSEHSGTEVPRGKLLDELRRQSRLLSTHELPSGVLCLEYTLAV